MVLSPAQRVRVRLLELSGVEEANVTLPVKKPPPRGLCVCAEERREQRVFELPFSLAWSAVSPMTVRPDTTTLKTGRSNRLRRRGRGEMEVER